VQSSPHNGLFCFLSPASTLASSPHQSNFGGLRVQQRTARPASIRRTSYVAAAVLEADFDARWAAWVAQGHAREEIARRKLGMFGGVLAIAGAVLYAFLR
jgi:hypothetical protein